jgi:hypothetical protein
MTRAAVARYQPELCSSGMFSLGSILSSPVVDGGILSVGSTDGNLYAVRSTREVSRHD